MPAARIWAVTEGHIGMVNQAVGLAEAIGTSFEPKVVRLRFPWTHIPPNIALPPLEATERGSHRIEPPWPDIVISCGRRSVGVNLAIRKASGGHSFAVHIQHPLIHPRHFDCVVMPEHDLLGKPNRWDNVICSVGAVHRVTKRRLAEGRRAFATRFEHLPHPRVAVLIGGSNRHYRMTPAVMRRVAEHLATLAREEGAGLMVTTSRRTGAENEAVLRGTLAGLPAYVWNGEGENPYFGLLAVADHIVVTGDSVNMVSEACFTGKPVHVIELEGGSRRFQAFHRSMREAGLTRTFNGVLETWSYEPRDETGRIAAEVRRRAGLG